MNKFYAGEAQRCWPLDLVDRDNATILHERKWGEKFLFVVELVVNGQKHNINRTVLKESGGTVETDVTQISFSSSLIGDSSITK